MAPLAAPHIARAADLKTIYRAETETMAQARLVEFAEKWGGKYPPITCT